MTSQYQSVDFNELETYDTQILEPRLMEFINKKKYYKKNHIIPSISLEKEYNISKNDIKIIKDFYNGKTNINYHQDLIDPLQSSSFESSKYNLSQDPRLKKVEQKQQKDKEANSMRLNFSNLNLNSNQNYMQTNLDTRPANFSHKVIKASQNKYNPNKNFFDDNINADAELNISRNNSINSRDCFKDEKWNPHKIQQNTPSKIPDYKGRLNWADNNYVNNFDNDIDNIVKKIDNYRIDNYKEDIKESYIDDENKVYISGMKCKNNRGNTNNYMERSIMTGKKGGDIEIDNYIRVGEGFGNTQSKKSIGYPSTYEHNFQYISNDMQIPEHTVMDRVGIATRTFNKTNGKAKYEREIMH